jgi:hypothetical protein
MNNQFNELTKGMARSITRRTALKIRRCSHLVAVARARPGLTKILPARRPRAGTLPIPGAFCLRRAIRLARLPQPGPS